MRRALQLFAVLLSGLLAACAGDPLQHAQALAQPAGLQRDQLRAGPFVLTTFSRISRSDLPVTVYIEGDGLAWRSRTRPSDDPTPRRALGLSLAAADTGANVAYLARPCQFTPMAANPACSVSHWTGRRYAEEVVAAMDAAVTQVLAATPGQRVHLVGYSGGAALAVLVAARRQDVASLRTVAGNLDPAEVNRLHRVSPMPDSLNPIDFAARVASIPQLHVSGGKDTVVPPAIAQRFVAASGACARLQVLAGLSHEGDWAGEWPRLLTLPLPCP